MDSKKTTIIGVVLIGVVMVAWMMYQQSVYRPVEENMQKSNKADSTQVSTGAKDETTNVRTAPASTTLANPDSVTYTEKFGQYFSQFAKGQEQYIRISTDNYSAVISNKGGSIVRWRLSKYKKWDGEQVQLINYKEKELYTRFTTTDAKKIDTRDLYFSVNGWNGEEIKLTGNESKGLTFTLDLGNGKSLIKKITFYGNKYHIEQDIVINNLDGILRGGYQLIWGHNLNYQEKNSADESQYSNGLISMNGSVDDFDATDEEIESKEFTGIIDYTAIKTKYFTTAIIPQPWQGFDGTASFSGNSHSVRKDGKVENYSMSIAVPYKGGQQHNSFKVFIGPIEYDLVKSYGIEATMDLGWRFLIRPIGEYLMRPLFILVYNVVPNYGIAIIIFAILIKIILYPLSIKQMRNASYMKLLAPEIEKRKAAEKDPKKQQMATMQVYSEYGINPASGCLPLLIQMPILFALWRTLNGLIELRQQPFILWITDLSAPDSLVSWGFSILGMTHISGLAVLMAAAMFIQQKMTITDPNQKMMVYMMPIMFLFMFSNFPSGLNLYYFMFNLLAIGQQFYINKFSSKKVTLADLKKNPKKKEGWFTKQMRMAQEMQQQTGKAMPPAMQRYIDNQNKKDGNNNSQNKNPKNKKKK